MRRLKSFNQRSRAQLTQIHKEVADLVLVTHIILIFTAKTIAFLTMNILIHSLQGAHILLKKVLEER